MKPLCALAVALVLVMPTAKPAHAAAPGGAQAATTSAATPAPAKRGIGARIKAGWRKMGKVGQTATVVGVTALTAFGLNQAGLTPVETATAIGGTMTLGVGTMALIAQRAKRIWSSSLAALKIKKLDDAHTSGNWGEVAGVLEELKSAAQANDSRAIGSKKDGKLQAKESAFLRFGIMRAELESNNDPDARHRLSGATLPAWKSQLGGFDTQAQAKVTRESEGPLALALVELAGEMKAEQAVLVSHNAAIAQFEDFVPAAFGGPMAKEVKRAKQLVSELKDGELNGEQELHGALTTKMRGRVSDRLAGENGEFKQRRVRHGDLKTLREGPVEGALHEAQRADSELGSAISDRQMEAFNETEAMMHTADVETYYDSESDGNGGTRSVARTRTVDNSGSYRAMAAMYASSARTHMSNANNAMSNLSGKLQSLASDRTMLSEQLASPHHGGMTSASGGPGLVGELFMPEAFNLFSNFMSSGNLSSAQSGVQQKLGALKSLHDEVSRRETGERTWLDGQIDTDLGRQMSTAAKVASAPTK
jgi:hypothetical protein